MAKRSLTRTERVTRSTTLKPGPTRAHHRHITPAKKEFRGQGHCQDWTPR